MTKLCIVSGNYEEARTWARSQELDDNSWFFPIDEDDLKQHTNFFVLVIGTAGHNVPVSYFNRFYELAQSRGRIGRF